MRGTLLPFVLGSILGAAAGAQVFVGTADRLASGYSRGFILLVTWMRISAVSARSVALPYWGSAQPFSGFS
jgi:hypothetical protein